MDKQKKQILILVVVLVLGGGVVVFMNRKSLFGEAPAVAPPAAPDPSAAPATPVPVPGAPTVAAGPAAPKDLPMPTLTIPGSRLVSVNANAFDPLFVKEPDVAYKKVAKDIQELKDKWKLVGIAEAGSETVKVTVQEKDAEGKWVSKVSDSTRTVWACFFADNPRFYREGDRLENTYFKVRRIVLRADGAFVEVEGDTGALVKLLIMYDDRYGVSKGK